MTETRSAPIRSESAALLSVENLAVEFPGTARVRAVRGISFEVEPGEIVSVVGESGSGKSVTAMSIMGLQGELGARITAGAIQFQQRDLTQLSDRDLREIRGRDMGMVFQDPLSSLDPLFTIGWQIAEAIKLHFPRTADATIRERVLELIAQVGIPNPSQRYNQYPYELSGGMRQRVMIAMALANGPRLLIADEPTTALDTTVQAGVLRLLRRIRDETGLAIIFITHDFGVVAETADRVLVMYGGEFVERAGIMDLFDDPLHPYSIALMRSRPSTLDDAARLPAIPGQAPDPTADSGGCRFQPRCWLSRGRERCVLEAPTLRALAPRHDVACHFAEEARQLRANYVL
jgi:oligopeptide/dipeptide ABC transporter ATP-binding protein